MKRPCLFTATLLCLLALDGGNLVRCQQKPSLAALHEYLVFKMERDRVPGLAACIIKDGRTVWSEGFGFQNLERKIPMTPRSVIGTASIAKVVTAAAIHQLAERKKLDLNDPINKVLPFRIQHPFYPDADITIAQLLGHTGSTSNGPSLWRSFSCGSQPMNLEEWVKAYFLPQGKFYHKEGNFGDWKPGDRFLYSNAGYALLAYVVEVVSGMQFNEFCRKNIFDPLEMHNTSFELSDVLGENLVTMYSFGYNMDLERDLMQPGVDCGKIITGDYLFPLCNYTDPTLGAGGLYSSVEELSHLLVALMNGGVYKNKVFLSKESVNKMLSPYVDSKLLPGQFAAFGLGCYAMKLNNNEPVWGHTGADPGISTFMLFNPETRIGAIVLASRFVDIRDLIEWLFAEAVGQYCGKTTDKINSPWRLYSKNRKSHRVVFRVVPNYLPGDSRIYVIGNHRYLGRWITTGIPMSPQRDRTWEKALDFPDSTRLEFKITRGGMKKQAVTMDGKVLPNYSLVVDKDTVLNIVVEDWLDQAQQ